METKAWMSNPLSLGFTRNPILQRERERVLSKKKKKDEGLGMINTPRLKF